MTLSPKPWTTALSTEPLPLEVMHDSNDSILGGAPPIGRTDMMNRAQNSSPPRRSRSISWNTPMMNTGDAESDTSSLESQNQPQQTRRRNRPTRLSLPRDTNGLSPPESSSAGSSATKFSDDCSTSMTEGQIGSKPQLGEGVYAESPEGDSLLGRAEDREVALPGRPRVPMSDDIAHLVAVHMTDYERYKRAYCYPPPEGFEEGKHTIDEYPSLEPFERKTPRGWTTYIHPEGTRYFYHDDARAAIPVITEAWLHDNELKEQIEGYMDKIFRYMVEFGLDFRVRRAAAPNQSDRGANCAARQEENRKDYVYFQDFAPVVLVLEVRLTGNMGYYFVHHREQRLFWLDKLDFSFEVGEVRIEHNNSTIGLEMKTHYWKHNDYFPHLYEFTDKDLVEIGDMIAFALGDALTSETSAVNSFNLEQLQLAQDIISRHEQRSPERRKLSVGERRNLCRLTSTLMHERFFNLHGERGARLDAKQSIHYSPFRRKMRGTRPETPEAGSLKWYERLAPSLFPQQQADDSGLVYADPEPCAKAKEMQSSSFWLDAATILMFGGPYVHANRLRDITWDGIVNKNLLAKYTERMVAEWRDVALYGTVLLGANVSFLTIQSVDEAGEGKVHRTPAQRASYFSILASLGTVVSSLVLLILVRHREVMGNKLIAGRSHSRWGLETLAVMYGTPFSLVIWSILGFFISFAILWSDRQDPVLVAIVVVSCVSFAIFLGWAVFASYTEEEPYRFLARAATRQVKAVGKVARKETVDMAMGATKRLSVIIPAMKGKGKRSRSQASEYTERRCESPTSLDNNRSDRTSSGSFELGTVGHARGHSIV